MFLWLLGNFALETRNLSQRMRYFVNLCILLSNLGIILTLGYIYYRANQYDRTKLQQEYLTKEEKRRKEELEILYRIGREINRWRHDITGEMRGLYEMMEGENMEDKEKMNEVKSYIERVDQSIRNYPELPQKTENEGLNAALIKAVPKCKEEGIDFYYQIIGEVGQIEKMDMGKLMNNLLDNGIEACMEAADERKLFLWIRGGLDGVLEIQLENSIKESVLENNLKMTSTKSETFYHGFGMENILEIVEKYHGDYMNWEEDGMFFQYLLFPLAMD